MAGAVSSCLRANQEAAPISAEQREETTKSEISQITNFLYLSGCTGLTPRRIRNLGITCAINCIKGVKQRFPPEIEYHYIPVEDEEQEDLRPYFEFVLSTIERQRENDGKILVYCGLGISRSATFVIAYFMQYQNKTLLDSYKTVQKSRSIICPNVGFFGQLLELEQKLYGKQTVKIIEPAPGVLVPDVVWEEVYEEVMRKMQPVSSASC